MNAAEAFARAISPATCDSGRAADILETASDILLDEIGRDELPERLISAQVALAVIIFNREGTEGESSRSEGGINRSYLDDLPADVRRRLKNYPRKVGAIYGTETSEA